MRKCKWAGDPADEYCKSCDGCKMVVDNVETECTNCAGYEASEEEVETTNSENVKEKAEPIMDEPVTTTKNEEKTDEKNCSKNKRNCILSASKGMAGADSRASGAAKTGLPHSG